MSLFKDIPLFEGSSSRRSPRILLFVLISCCLLFILGYSNRLMERTRVTTEIELWQQKIEGAKQETALLYRQLRIIQGDNYVDKIARRELGLTRLGDKPLVVISEQQEETFTGLDNKPPASVRLFPLRELPYWQQWLALFDKDFVAQ